MEVVTLRVPIRNVIHHVSSFRGTKIGKCLGCGAVGLFHKFGFPNSAGDRLEVTHKKGCSMNKYIARDGSLKKHRKRD